MQSGNPGPAQQAWEMIYQHCHEPPAVVLLSSHTGFASKALAAPTHQVFSKVQGKLPSLSWIYSWTQWQKGIFHQNGSMKPCSGKSTGNKWERQLQSCSAVVAPSSPSHTWVPQHLLPSLHWPSPPSTDQFPERGMEFQTRPLSPTSELQNPPFPFYRNRLTWNRDFEPNLSSFVPSGWRLLALVSFQQCLNC